MNLGSLQVFAYQYHDYIYEIWNMVGTFTVPLRLIFADRETPYTVRKVDRHTRGVEIWSESQSENNQQTPIPT
jgi:hypothetical protein